MMSLINPILQDNVDRMIGTRHRTFYEQDLRAKGERERENVQPKATTIATIIIVVDALGKKKKIQKFFNLNNILK